MTFLWFLITYAWRDLRDPASRRSTRVTLGTLAAAIAATLGGFGFAFGVDRISKKRLDDNPFAKTLWTGGGWRSGRITPGVLDDLRKAVPPGTQVFPFRTVSIEFTRTDGTTSGEVPGRTISFEPGAEDTLFRSRPVRPGGTELTAPTDRGIVITPTLLKSLGHDPETFQPPTTILGSYQRSEPKPILVIGVTREDLPLFHKYVVADEYVRELGERFETPELTGIFTNALPQAWVSRAGENPPIDRAKRVAAKEIDDERLAVLLKDRKFKPVWQLNLGEGRTGLSVRRWQEVLAVVNRELQTTHPVAAFTLALDTTGFQLVRPPTRTDHDFAAVVVPTLDDVTAAAQAIVRVPTYDGDALPVNSDVVEKLAQVNEQTKWMIRAVLVVEVFLVVIAAVNLMAVQAMRAHRQIAEVGMLKAMGMSRTAVLLAYLIEAMMLWVPAALLGTLGAIGAVAASLWLCFNRDLQAIWDGLAWSWTLYGYAIGGSFVLTLLCVGVACGRAVFASPSETLREGR